jgi:hypothetical protein
MYRTKQMGSRWYVYEGERMAAGPFASEILALGWIDKQKGNSK